jgi:hypothetical protein
LSISSNLVPALAKLAPELISVIASNAADNVTDSLTPSLLIIAAVPLQVIPIFVELPELAVPINALE